MKFGVFDVIDNSWAYDNKGPLLFDRQDEAILAAKSVCLKLKNRSRFLPKEFPDNASIKLKSICLN